MTPPLTPRLTGPSREPVSELQHARILSAMAEIACERGIAKTTVSHVVARAGVSRRTYYNLFADRTDCFLAAFDAAVEQASTDVVAAWRCEQGWAEQLRAGLFALLRFLEEEPVLANLCVVQSVAGDSRILARRAEIVMALAAAVDEGRALAAGKSLTPILAEGLVGAVLAIVHARIAESETPRLGELLNSLMGLLVVPYLGPEAHARELARPAPRIPATERADGLNELLSRLEMRVTYRTLRVLAAIDAEPGASNRRVGVVAGIADQGQTSKLLNRLERLGLIGNTGEGHTRGLTNSWRLTSEGAELQRLLRVDRA